MKIDNLKELGQVLDLCHKKGVLSIELDGIKIHMGERPQPKNLKTEQAADKIETPDQYTDEQILMWSSAGING